jgi:hypothetical protein
MWPPWPVPDGRWPMRRAPRRGVVCKTRPQCGIESPALAMSLGETQWRLSGRGVRETQLLQVQILIIIRA